jgi:hypothetical protein
MKRERKYDVDADYFAVELGQIGWAAPLPVKRGSLAA